MVRKVQQIPKKSNVKKRIHRQCVEVAQKRKSVHHHRLRRHHRPRRVVAVRPVRMIIVVAQVIVHQVVQIRMYPIQRAIHRDQCQNRHTHNR